MDDIGFFSYRFCFIRRNYIIPWNRVLCEKLIFTELVE
jgi:hypothetical protein